MRDPFYSPQTRLDALLVESASLGNLQLYIRGHAARYLADLSEETIEQALQRLNGLFDDWELSGAETSPAVQPLRGTELRFIRSHDERGEPVSEDQAGHPILFRAFSPALELFYRSEDPEVLAAFDGLGLHWPGLLAIVALGYLDAAGRAREAARASTDPEQSAHLADRASALAAYAMEAISLADRSLGGDSFAQHHFRSLTRQKTQAAGRARHARTEALKTRFRTYYESREWPSKAACARSFLASLSENERRVLSPNNGIRTLTESLKG